MKIAFSISPVNKQWVVIKEVIWNTIRQRLRKRLNGISYYLLQHFQLSIYELLATTLSVMSSGCATREKPWQSLAHEVSWPDVMWLIPNELWKLTSSSRKKKYNLLYTPNFRFIPVYALSKKTQISFISLFHWATWICLMWHIFDQHNEKRFFLLTKVEVTVYLSFYYIYHISYKLYVFLFVVCCSCKVEDIQTWFNVTNNTESSLFHYWTVLCEIEPVVQYIHIFIYFFI